MATAATHDEVARRILVVEAAPDNGTSLRYSLEVAGFQVATANTGTEALRLCSTFRPELVLLDIVLPDISGFDVCREMRAGAEYGQPAIIVISARTQEADRIGCFEAGADDFVAKPYGVSELMLRIRRRLEDAPARENDGAVVSGQSSAHSDEIITVGALHIDPAIHRVFLSNREIRLSLQEMRLLAYLARQANKLCSRRDLLTSVWGYHPEATSRTLDTHVKRLRDKLRPFSSMIQTVHGVGYRMVVSVISAPDFAGEPQRRRRR